MYGLVNQGVRDLVMSQHGADAWARIRTRAQVEFDEFRSMAVYDDAVTYALVEAASLELDVPATDLLFAFGEHWILFSAEAGYGAMLEMCGDSFLRFLRGLDDMHARVGMTMSELRAPSFHLESSTDDACRLRYASERVGLAPFVTGLLSGLAKRFGIEVDISDLSTDDPSRPNDRIFVVARRGGSLQGWT